MMIKTMGDVVQYKQSKLHNPSWNDEDRASVSEDSSTLQFPLSC